MTDDEVRLEILIAIIECQVTDERREIDSAKEVGNAVFSALKKKGLLKLDADTDDELI